MLNYKILIENWILDSCKIKQYLITEELNTIKDIAVAIAKSLNLGGKIMFCGNGGSAADSQHLAAELVVKFKQERKGLAGIALTTDSSVITACANDFSYDEIFARQVQTLGKAGDILVGISTSGKSKNIIKAIKIAKNLQIYTIGFTGSIKPDVNLLKKSADLCLCVNSNEIAKVQEAHIMVGHIIINLVEQIIKQEDRNSGIR